MKAARPYQYSLWDPPFSITARGPNTPILDIKAGREAKNAGIKKAMVNADRVNPEWSEKAYQFLLKFLANHNGTFMAEEVRCYAELMDLEVPPSRRAWGGVIVRAKTAGLIESCGQRLVKNKAANQAWASLWRPVKRVSR